MPEYNIESSKNIFWEDKIVLKIKDVKVNYLVNPVGISGDIQIGWVLDSDKRNVVQTSYRVQIASDMDFEHPVYDSGETSGDESAHVKVQGITWESAVRYDVRVKACDNCGEESKWSTPAFFVSGLQGPDQWTAAFVSAETPEDKDNSKGTYVRKTFGIKGKVKSAYVLSTALGLYHMYINGQRVSTDEFAPGWTSYNKRLLYQTYDVTAFLTEGANAAGAMLGAGWYKGVMGFMRYRNHYGVQTAFACQIMIRYEDGTSEVISSDESWKGNDSPVLFSEIYDGEIYDAGKEIDGWDTAAFDDGSWRKVNIVSVSRNILAAQNGCAVREMTAIPAKRIFTTKQGDTVIDFGQNLTGWIHFRVKGQAGDKAELKCFEVLDSDGNVYLDNLRSAKETVTYICKDDKEAEFHPYFSFQGFQYAVISSWPGTPVPADFTAWAVHSDMEETGTFTCSNPDLNQLQHNIVWGMKGNFLDIPTDCPQRDERLGWTGDSQIFCRTASYIMNTYTFYSKWLKDLEADQTPEGGVAHVVPDILTGKADDDRLLKDGTHSAAAWGDAAVINPWTLYLTYGDKAVIETQYESMKAWIGFMHSHAVNGIWNYQLQFGDWVALDAEEGSYFGATPNDLTCTAYYAYSTGLLAKMAQAVGKSEDARKYGELYKEIVKGYQDHFFTKDGELTAQTQTAHILSLYFDLVPDAYRDKTVQGLLRLLEKENGHLVTGFVGTPYFCHALSGNGHAKEAYDLLLKEDFPSWLYQVKMGATTIWEHWDGLKPDGTMWSPDMNSFNHYAYGAIGEWLYRVSAGIEIDENHPGYKHSIIYPRIGGDLTFVDASYNSVYGPVTVRWSCINSEVTIDVTVPHNTTADIILDQAVQVMEADGLIFSAQDTNMAATAGSGKYSIRFIR